MKVIILSRPDRVGDVVISTSCLAPIKRKYPEARLYFVAAETMRPLLEGHPLLAGYISLSSDLTREFKHVEASALVHLHPNANCYLAGKWAGIPVRIGYPLGLFNDKLTHRLPDHRRQGLQHEGAYNFELLRPLELERPAQLSANVHLPEASRVTLQSQLPWPLAKTRFAVLSPTAHSKIARWPMEHFLRTAERLKKEFDLLPVFIGANANDSIPASKTDYLNLAGKTNLAELGWLLKHAQVLVTNPSGPSHLGAAVNCPVISLFGRTAPIYGPARWRPLSPKAIVIAKSLAARPFERRETYWRRCFAEISVAEVMAAAAAILA